MLGAWSALVHGAAENHITDAVQIAVELEAVINAEKIEMSLLPRMELGEDRLVSVKLWTLRHGSKTRQAI